MTTRHSHRLGLASLICLLLASGALDPVAVAQNREADLVRENERLRAEVDELAKALEAAMRRIDSLEKRLAGSTTGSNAATGSPAAPPESSPDGAIAAIRKGHEKATAEGAIVPPGERGDAAAEARHVRSLQRWIAAANRMHRKRVTWPVRIESVTPIDISTAKLEVTPWNPESGETTGDAFTIRIPARVRDRLQRLRPQGNDERLVVELEGVFTPAIRYNSNRLEVGPFDNPRFIAPRTEMTWSLDFKSLGPMPSPGSQP